MNGRYVLEVDLKEFFDILLSLFKDKSGKMGNIINGDEVMYGVYWFIVGYFRIF